MPVIKNNVASERETCIYRKFTLLPEILRVYLFYFQIRAEAAYLYDAVHLYTNALITVLAAGDNPKNGTAIVDAIKGNNYLSAMG